MERGDVRIGIMGGTFDPIHYGHLIAAEEAKDKFAMDKVLFIPSGDPPHKKNYKVTPAELRYAMTLLATVGNPKFDVSRIEINRKGYSYTIDTLREIRENCPEADYYFITGADAILDILSWKDPKELLRLCKFIAATRPGYCLNQLDRVMAKLGYGSWREEKLISILEIPAVSISSTEIRLRVQNGQSIRYLVPDEVLQFIMKNKLYR
jgi:nicotinate-nucleotide adenylyltransferase